MRKRTKKQQQIGERGEEYEDEDEDEAAAEMEEGLLFISSCYIQSKWRSRRRKTRDRRRFKKGHENPIFPCFKSMYLSLPSPLLLPPFKSAFPKKTIFFLSFSPSRSRSRFISILVSVAQN
jgi:hypothetical protein